METTERAGGVQNIFHLLLPAEIRISRTDIRLWIYLKYLETTERAERAQNIFHLLLPAEIRRISEQKSGCGFTLNIWRQQNGQDVHKI